MILSKMLKQCKKNKHIQIISYGAYGYLFDNSVAGVIDADVDDWTAQDCAAAIGISDDDRDKYIFPPVTRRNIIDLEPVVPMECSIELPSGAVVQPFMFVDKRIFFIDADLLKIFDCVHDKRYFFGDDTLVIARGSFIVGFINPMRVNLNKLSAYVADLLTGLNASEEAAFFDADGQMEIKEPAEAEKER